MIPQSAAIAASAIPLKFHSESKIWEKIFQSPPIHWPIYPPPLWSKHLLSYMHVEHVISDLMLIRRV